MCGCKLQYLEHVLMFTRTRQLRACPFRKTINRNGFHPRVYDCSSHQLLTTFIVTVYGVGLQYNQTAVGQPHKVNAIISLMGISCHTGCFCRSQGSYLDKVDDLSPLALLLAPSCTMKSSNRGGNYHFQSRLSFFMFCDQNVCSLQQQAVTISVSWVTKNSSLYYLGAS